MLFLIRFILNFSTLINTGFTVYKASHIVYKHYSHYNRFNGIYRYFNTEIYKYNKQKPIVDYRLTIEDIKIK